MNKNDPLSMQPGWDPTTPGKEYVQRVLDEWEYEGYIPTVEELAELDY